MRILVVEDEPELNRMLKKRLTEAHYSVDACDDGSLAQDYLACAEYDAVVLDIMLPGISGLELLRRMREKGDRTPVLLLTAKDGIEDRVAGLDSGADDYLVKPFAFDELLARLRVMVRRASKSVSEVFTIADLTVDCAARTVKRGETPIELSGKEFYRPSGNGYEAKIRPHMKRIKREAEDAAGEKNGTPQKSSFVR